MRDESHLDQATRDALGSLRSTIKEQGIENARAQREVSRLTRQVEWLKESVREKREALHDLATFVTGMSKTWDGPEIKEASAFVAAAIRALDDDSDHPTEHELSKATNYSAEPPMQFVDKDSLGRGGLR